MSAWRMTERASGELTRTFCCKDFRLNSETKISLEDFDQKSAHEFLLRFVEAKEGQMNCSPAPRRHGHHD